MPHGIAGFRQCLINTAEPREEIFPISTPRDIFLVLYMRCELILYTSDPVYGISYLPDIISPTKMHTILLFGILSNLRRDLPSALHHNLLK